MPSDSAANKLLKAPLELDPKHPGIDDPVYVSRRHQLYDLAFEARVHDRGFPTVDYTPAEHAIWRNVSERLVQAHQLRACQIYLEGKRLLQIETRFMPQLGDLDRVMRSHHDFGLCPAEGLLDVRTFFEYLKLRQMPCTQFLRHHKVPEFTPEPDAVHDVIGHVPCLMNKPYTDVVQKIGQGVLASTNQQQLDAWTRLYWFTVEFGLIREGSATKVFGAGLLSSLEEIEYCLSDAVTRRPFILDEVIATSYDPSFKQDVVFVIPSLAELSADVELLRARFGH